LKVWAWQRRRGFDGVDIKTCHGYLGSELLRPLNQRRDKFGGSVENRAYLIASVIESAVKKFPGLIVGSRMSVFEGIRGGCGTSAPGEILEDLEDMRQIAAIFVAAGAHFLNISGGLRLYNSQLIGPGKKDNFCRLSQYRYTRQFKEWFPNTALIGSTYTMGDMSSIDFAEENVSKGYTDFAGFGRQNLADARFPRKIRDGDESVQYCTQCGRCSKSLSNDVNVFCGHHHSDNPYK
jgi:2,4-dienoyl-CoA reductase-like NADH-dependent reductase (Old Yellow Enzyme family)